MREGWAREGGRRKRFAFCGIKVLYVCNATLLCMIKVALERGGEVSEAAAIATVSAPSALFLAAAADGVAGGGRREDDTEERRQVARPGRVHLLQLGGRRRKES